MDLAELARELVAMFEPQAARGEVTLRIAAPASTPLEGDEQRLRQVLENLVTNALRHTPAGGEVSVAVTRGEDDVRVAVSDTGSGISPADLEWIFERYRKSPDSGGTGLGLAIARRLVEAHGGMIRAESEPGRGTTISFTVPVTPSAQ
jgi:signal transduction histidine kinase